MGIVIGTSILRFLLGPGHGGVGILFKLSNNFFEREWAKRLHSDDSDVVLFVFSSAIRKVKVDLSGTEYNFFDLFVINELFILVLDNILKARAICKVFNFRGGSFISKQLFRSDHNQWFSEWHPHLGPQHVEIVCRC